MKDKNICKTCRFFLNRSGNPGLYGTCDYISITGHSRIMVERENGSYKSNICALYEPKTGSKRKHGSGVQLKGSTPRRRKAEKGVWYE